jgi:hypothetical protein
VSSTSNFSKLNEFFFRAVVIRKSIRSKVWLKQMKIDVSHYDTRKAI